MVRAALGAVIGQQVGEALEKRGAGGPQLTMALSAAGAFFGSDPKAAVGLLGQLLGPRAPTVPPHLSSPPFSSMRFASPSFAHANAQGSSAGGSPFADPGPFGSSAPMPPRSENPGPAAHHDASGPGPHEWMPYSGRPEPARAAASGFVDGRAGGLEPEAPVYGPAPTTAAAAFDATSSSVSPSSLPPSPIRFDTAQSALEAGRMLLQAWDREGDRFDEHFETQFGVTPAPSNSVIYEDTRSRLATSLDTLAELAHAESEGEPISLHEVEDAYFSMQQAAERGRLSRDFDESEALRDARFRHLMRTRRE